MAPESVCLQAIAKEIEGPMKTVGIVALITALIAFLGFCGSFPLCTKFDTENDEDEK